MAIELVSFREATDRLSRLLRDCGVDGDMIWVFREDLVAGSKGKIYVRTPVPAENGRLAEAEYDRGVGLGLGAELATLCTLAGAPCCYVWVPKGTEDAGYALLAGLKLSVPTAPPVASPLKGSWRERVAVAFGREPAVWWADRVPSKENVAGLSSVPRETR